MEREKRQRDAKKLKSKAFNFPAELCKPTQSSMKTKSVM
jgi:hypothetical protein